MSATELFEQAKSLPFAQRLELAQTLWDDIMQSSECELSPEEAAVIDERLREHEANPEDVVPWEEVKVKAGLDGPCMVQPSE